ncbi:MAG: dihydroxyacetone kinase subunit L [Anaerolineae bacterium]|nr:dihydroxyacetone kinase subunit L [Anaerolineae bacterium]
MDSFPTTQVDAVVRHLIRTIQDNAAYLSEIDGAIGDGDHGINMSKGFTRAGERLGEHVTLSEGLQTIGDTLLDEIGGAMGPLYGLLFQEMAFACKGKAEIDKETFGQMLRAAVDAVQDMGGAQPGDKTLIDTLIPARDAYLNAVAAGVPFADALRAMADGAERGKESTRDLVAKIGRASRLGERSRGHLDAGATSCCLILKSLAESITTLL